MPRRRRWLLNLRRGFFVADRVYIVEFHFASMLSPPFTFCPRRTTICASMGSQTSTREPKRMMPTRSPRATASPFRFPAYHATRDCSGNLFEHQRPAGVSMSIIFCSFSREAAARSAA